jgi:hypothetical protein
VIVTPVVSSKADGVQLRRLQWRDYRVLLGAQKAYENRPEESAKWEEHYRATKREYWEEVSGMRNVARSSIASSNPNNPAQIWTWLNFSQFR